MRARRLWILFSTLALALGLVACGRVNDPPSDENDGVYVNAGPITYQLEVSRQLNPYGTEDSQYLLGLPAGTAPLAPDQLWFGVFMWAENQTNQPHPTTDDFVIEDTEGNRYYPVHLNSAINQYAWTPQVLGPGAQEPGPSTTAAQGPTGGALLLFRLNVSVYSNRPLTLYIYPPGQTKASTIQLNL